MAGLTFQDLAPKTKFYIEGKTQRYRKLKKPVHGRNAIKIPTPVPAGWKPRALDYVIIPASTPVVIDYPQSRSSDRDAGEVKSNSGNPAGKRSRSRPIEAQDPKLIDVKTVKLVEPGPRGGRHYPEMEKLHALAEAPAGKCLLLLACQEEAEAKEAVKRFSSRIASWRRTKRIPDRNFRVRRTEDHAVVALIEDEGGKR